MLHRWFQGKLPDMDGWQGLILAVIMAAHRDLAGRQFASPADRRSAAEFLAYLRGEIDP